MRKSGNRGERAIDFVDMDERGLRSIEQENPIAVNLGNTGMSVDERYHLEDYEYRWVRTEVRGANDYRFESSMSEGWRPVPRDRVSDVGYCDPLDRNPNSKNYICFKDVIYMERPRRLGMDTARKQREKTDNATRAIGNVVQNDNLFARN